MHKKKPLSKVLSASLLSAILLAAAPLNQSTAHAAAASSAAVLAQGMSGSNVSGLQSDLKTLGYFTYPNITGYFGSITAQAVSDFQQAYSLPVSGTADSVSRTAIAHALVKKQLLADTRKYMYTPYVWGGSSPSGFDCSGFVYYMFTTHGIAMQRDGSAVMAGWGTHVDRSRLMPGDLVFFETTDQGVVSHVGIYVGGGQFISATRSKGIYTQSMDTPYWSSHYRGARRYY